MSRLIWLSAVILTWKQTLDQGLADPLPQKSRFVQTKANMRKQHAAKAPVKPQLHCHDSSPDSPRLVLI